MWEELIKRFTKSQPINESRLDLKKRGLKGEGLEYYLQTPLPTGEELLKDVQFLALDFETTGVDIKQDHILSVGTVPLTINEISVAEAHEFYIDNARYIKANSASVNEITPQILRGAYSIEQAMDILLGDLAGKVLVVHGAWIEKAFINRFFERYFHLSTFPYYVVDTLQLEKRLSYAGRTDPTKSLQLDELRAAYNLPPYRAHSAASDALACAELFSVQYRKLTKLKKLRLADVVC